MSSTEIPPLRASAFWRIWNMYMRLYIKRSADFTVDMIITVTMTTMLLNNHTSVH
jgi:hypothetical protein